jgi:hypothetical protein
LKGFSYTTRDMEEIPLLLSTIVSPAVIAADSVLISQNPAQRFKDVVATL